MAEGKLVDINEWLYRRGFSCPPKNYLNPDGSATSRVFKPRIKDEGKLSVDVKSLTTPEKSVGDTSKHFLFELPNSSVHEIGLETYHDALPDGTNDSHALIVGFTDNDEISPGLLARASKRVII
jgi:hypothetical protein